MTHSNIINGIPQGCFGPFPSLNIDGVTYTPMQTQIISGSLGKRKWFDNLGSNFHLNSISRMANLTELEHSLSFVMAHQQKNAIKIDHIPTIIDLNKNPVATSNGSSSYSLNSYSSEVDKKIEVGKELGFEIDSSNPVLLEAMGVIGETNNPR